MKVVHVSTSDMGGAGIAAKRLHQALLENGISSHFLTLLHLGAPVEHHSVIGSAQKVTGYSYLKKRIRGILEYRLPFLFKNAREEFFKSKPKGFDHFSFPYSEIDLANNEIIKQADIVHLHWVSDGMLDYKKFFKGNTHSMVWTLHDMNPFTGGCHHADDSRGFMGDCSDCPQVKGTADESVAFKNLREKISALENIREGQLHIVTPSSWLGDLAGKSRAMGRFGRSVIPNIIPVNTFKPYDKLKCREELNIPGEAKVILFVANDVSNIRKGIRELLGAINNLTGDGVVVCTVGNKLPDNSINKKLVQLGYITSEEKMAKVYSAADVFVLPSHAENFPNTIMESLLCGVPVVASDVGGIPEQVDSWNGILFEKGNTSALANAILKVLEHKDAFNPAQMRESVLKKVSPNVIVKKYTDIYSALLKKK
jgi:glycosyltransferase involved in cell wall biosynthesis